MDQNRAGFLYFTLHLRGEVKLNSEKGICWTSNKRVNTGRKCEDQLSEVERAAWKSFKIVTTKFVGNYKAEKYRDMVADFVPSYKA